VGKVVVLRYFGVFEILEIESDLVKVKRLNVTVRQLKE
jgi:hypothetical protein